MIIVKIYVIIFIIACGAVGFYEIHSNSLKSTKRILKQKTSIAKTRKENFFYHTTQDAYEISLIREYCTKNKMKLEITLMCLYYCCKISWE